MPKRIEPLTDKAVRAAKPQAKEYKLFDGGGLYLSVTPKGQKWWRLKYRFKQKERRISLGVYPAVTLAAAREERARLKDQIKRGIDPSLERKEAKAQKEEETKKANTFEVIAKKWLKGYQDQVSESYHKKISRMIEKNTYPHIGTIPIDEVNRRDIIAILEALKEKGVDETARRTSTLLNKIFKYAVTYEYIPHNIIADIDKRDILGKQKKRHYPTLTKPDEIRGLLLAIDAYQGDYSTLMALRVLPYLFVRSYNIRHMEWREINWDTKEWIIPPEKMKTKEEFVLPLPHQVLTLLEEVKANQLSPVYVFPSSVHRDRSMSDNTLRLAIRRMGYTKEQFVPHGFRAMFSTTAYEWANRKSGHGYTGEVIEALLAHKEPNEVKAAYNRSKYREPMRGLIQWYADYLEGVKHEN